MLTAIISMIVFALAYAIKGGSGNVLENWDEVRSRNAVYDRLLDGKILSTIIVLVFALFFVGGLQAVFISVMWLAAVAPSMGEEHGAIGDFDGMLPAYKKRSLTSRGRAYDVKKGVQRGVFMGACMALATGFTGFIVASAFFVPAVFIGQELNRLILKTPGWTVAEPIIGLIVFGVPMAFYLT